VIHAALSPLIAREFDDLSALQSAGSQRTSLSALSALARLDVIHCRRPRAWRECPREAAAVRLTALIGAQPPKPASAIS
jgi:hypothetical protein